MTIQCHACGWHYTLGISEQNPLQLQPSMASSHGVATPTVQVSKCAGINNKGCNKNAHGSCTRRCCRSCCVGMGGCRGVKGHSETHLSERQRMKAKARNLNTSIQQQQPSHVRWQPTSPVINSTSIHGPVYFGGLAQMLSESNPVPPLQCEDKQCELADQLAADQALANFAQSLSESDPVLQLKCEDKRREQAEQLAADKELAKELQEEEEHEALLAETRTALLSSPADPGPSTRTTSALSSSSKASPSTFLVSGLPVTRVTSKNWPTITTQMNETWMRDYDDKTKEKRRVGGNSQIDLEMVQKFRVIWWEKVCIFISS